jgi:imelysin
MRRPRHALTALCAGAALVAGSAPLAAAPGPRLDGVKAYLLAHAGELAATTGQLEATAARYDALAKAAGYDTAVLLRTRRAEVARLLARAKAQFLRANPAYEEMEGVVAGVPSLSQYDVDIDAGAGAKEDPSSAVSFDVKTSDGRVFRKPGNYFALAETSLWGTRPELLAEGGRRIDLNGDGRVTFGESLPDPRFLAAATRDFHAESTRLLASARAWSPTSTDVFTALVVMVPTMNEYFQSWKASRFVAGSRAREASFVATSRLGDIRDILEGLKVIYRGTAPLIARVDAPRSRRLASRLEALRALAADLLRRENAGTRFTPEQADLLGAEAQDRATAIAGEISQSASKLKITISQ